MIAKHLRTPFLTEHLQWTLLTDVQKAPETSSDCLTCNPIYMLHPGEFWSAVLASSFIKVKKMNFFMAWVIKQIQNSLRERCPNTEFFLVCIQSEYRKYGPGKTPHLDTFQAVCYSEVWKQDMEAFTWRCSFATHACAI